MRPRSRRAATRGSRLIHSLTIVLGLLAPPTAPPPAAPSSVAPPSVPASVEPVRVPDRSIERHRSAVDALIDRAVGRTSRAVRYDWRRSPVQVGLIGALPAELNNYDALTAGVFARIPTQYVFYELALSYVWVSGSDSSEKLALTPYRQPARPSHVQLDFAVGVPLAEGVVTPMPGALPAAQLVFSGVGQLRYLIHPGAWRGLSLTEGLRATVDGELSDKELGNLEDDRLPGMQLDPGRYALWAGFNTDVYFQSGLFFAQKTIFSVPLLAPATETALFFGFELSISAGFSF